MPTETLRAPEGWRTVSSPTDARAGVVARDDDATFDITNVEARYTSLRDWATANGLQLSPSDYTIIHYAEYLDIYCWTTFQIRRVDTPNNDSVIAPFPCTGCGTEIGIGQVYCGGCDRFIVCDTCHLAGLRLYGVRGQEGNGACPSCSVECVGAGCTNRLPRGDGFDRCATCDPRAGCAHCARMVPLAQLVTHTFATLEYLICPNCVTTVCAECDGHFDHTNDRTIGDDTLHICDTCAQVHYDKERAKFERWDHTELPISGSLMIPGTASRPIRTISIETEFDGDGVKVGRALASAGLLPAPDRNRYGTQGDATDRFPCLLKSDASVTGGELVTYLIDLDNDNHAAALMRMTEVMRGCRELGLATFTHRAGGHVHIDLHGLTARDMWAQYTIFNYLQMPIFYLAGAGAEYGHRTLAGSGYTDAGPVGPFGTVGQFAQQILNGRGDRWALHYGNFAGARGRCSCGAYVTGEWADCTCNLGKATAEWRVWNAEVTPRILHAWLALMQALTAYATDLEGFTEDDFPALQWTGNHFDRLSSAQKVSIKERLEWIHRELPLTLHERDSLIYAFKRSELIGLGEDYLNGLIDIEAENEFGTKKPARNPNTREAAFTLAAVAGAGADANYVDDFYAGEDEEEDDDDGW